MTTRGSQSIKYDPERRPVRVDVGGTICRFAYDGDGIRRKRLDNNGTIHYVGSHYERPSNGRIGNGLETAEVVTKYYLATFGPSAGRMSRLVALRRAGTLYWVGTDHLGSTIRVADSGFNAVDGMRYRACGGSRDVGSNLKTDHKYTGQIEDGIIGLYWYNSRAYDVGIGRFVAPDTIVPEAGNLQALNRYSYVYNNPLRFIDPSGHRMIEGTGVPEYDQYPSASPLPTPTSRISGPNPYTGVPSLDSGGGSSSPALSPVWTPVPIPSPAQPQPVGTPLPVPRPTPVGTPRPSTGGNVNLGDVVTRVGSAAMDYGFDRGVEAVESGIRPNWGTRVSIGYGVWGGYQVALIDTSSYLKNPNAVALKTCMASGVGKAVLGGVGSGISQFAFDQLDRDLGNEQRLGRAGISVAEGAVVAGAVLLLGATGVGAVALVVGGGLFFGFLNDSVVFPGLGLE